MLNAFTFKRAEAIARAEAAVFLGGDVEPYEMENDPYLEDCPAWRAAEGLEGFIFSFARADGENGGPNHAVWCDVLVRTDLEPSAVHSAAGVGAPEILVYV